MSVCAPRRKFLGVVGSCCAKFDTGQTFEPTTPTFLLMAEAKLNNVRSVCPALPTLLGPRTRITHGLLGVYKVLWVVSFPGCTAGPNIVGSCCILSVCIPLPTWTQQLPTLLARQCCCVRLHVGY